MSKYYEIIKSNTQVLSSYELLHINDLHNPDLITTYEKKLNELTRQYPNLSNLYIYKVAKESIKNTKELKSQIDFMPDDFKVIIYKTGIDHLIYDFIPFYYDYTYFTNTYYISKTRGTLPPAIVSVLFDIYGVNNLLDLLNTIRDMKDDSELVSNTIRDLIFSSPIFGIHQHTPIKKKLKIHNFIVYRETINENILSETDLEIILKSTTDKRVFINTSLDYSNWSICFGEDHLKDTIRYFEDTIRLMLLKEAKSNLHKNLLNKMILEEKRNQLKTLKVKENYKKLIYKNAGLL